MPIHKHDNQAVLDGIASAPLQPTVSGLALADLLAYDGNAWHNTTLMVSGGITATFDPTYHTLTLHASGVLPADADGYLYNNGYGVTSWRAAVPATDITFAGVNVQPGYEITLDKYMDYIWSSGKVFGFALTEVGDGTVNIAYGVAMLRTGDTMSPFFSPLQSCYIAGVTGLALTDNAVNYVYAYYNGGSPTIAVSTDITTIHATDKVLLYIVTRVGTTLDYADIGRYQGDFMAKYAKKLTAQAGGAEYGFGSITTESDTRKLAITQGAFYFVNEQYATPVFDSNGADTFTLMYRSGASTWTRTSSQAQLGNTQYNRLSDNTLQTLGNNNYGVYWVFWLLDSPTRLIVVYGQGDYANLAAAEAAGIPTSLPPEVQTYSTGVLIAKIIFLKNATNFYSVSNPFTSHFYSSVATIHNGLSGLQGGTTDQYYHLTAGTTANQTLRADGTNWIGSSFLYNTGTAVGVNKTTFGTVEKFGVNPAITVDNLACVQLTSVADANKPLVIQRFSATQSANLTEWQQSTGAVLSAISAVGNLGLGRATAPYTLSIQGVAACDSPTLGAEFLAASPWTSTGWTGSWAGGWTHTVGNTDALVFTTAIGGSSVLKVVYTVTGRTAGTFNLQVGGISLLSRSTSGVWGPITLSPGNFTVTPSSDFDGTIVFSIKTITGDSTPIGALYDSAGTVAVEFRTTNGQGANTFFGIGAGARNVGLGNTAIGYQAGGHHTGGDKNALIGAYCGYSMGAGSANVVVGYEALYNGNNVTNCVALGYGALNKAVSSVSNIGIGFNALYNSTGSYNIAIGQGAFQQVTTGDQNLAIGAYSAGYNVTTGSNNIFIGLEADLSSSTQRSRAMAIGYKAKVNQDDSCVIGQTGASAPLLGLNTTTPGAQIHVNARSATTIGAIVIGAAAQTANLQEWRDSTSTVLSAIDAAGRSVNPTQAVTADATIAGSRVKFTGSTASQTLTLPAGVVGLEIFVRNAASVSVTVASAGSDTIEGETSMVLSPGESALLTFIGTDWTAF